MRQDTERQDNKQVVLQEGEVETGSGNVFADLGLPDADELLLKSRMILEIKKIIEAKGWTQMEAADAVGLDQPRLSKLLRGKMLSITLDKLVEIVDRLGYCVEIEISPKKVHRKSRRQSRKQNQPLELAGT